MSGPLVTGQRPVSRGPLPRIIGGVLFLFGFLIAVAWLLALGIGGVLNTIPFVGTVLGAIVAFYGLVAVYYVIGRTWGDLHPVADAVPTKPCRNR